MKLTESVKYAKHAIKKASVYDTHREVSRFRCDIAAELRTKNKTTGRAKLAVYRTSIFEVALSDSEAVIVVHMDKCLKCSKCVRRTHFAFNSLV